MSDELRASFRSTNTNSLVDTVPDDLRHRDDSSDASPAGGDRSSSMSGSDIRGPGDGGSKCSTDDQQRQLMEDDKQVLCIRILVFLVLLGSTIGVSIAVHRYIVTQERNLFEQHYEDDSNKVLEAIGTTVDLTLGAVDSFLVAMASHAKATNATWPFVTVPDYAVRVSKLLTISKAVLVSQYHLVSLEEKQAWEDYSVTNDGWVREGVEVQKTDATYFGDIVEEWTVNPEIDGVNEMGPFLPKWQQAPVIAYYSPYNWDAYNYDSLVQALPTIRDERKIAFGAINNMKPFDVDGDNNKFIEAFVGEDKTGKDHTEPFMDMFFPILKHAADVVSLDQFDGSDPTEFVGVFGMSLYWRDWMQNILPKDSPGVVVVITNTLSNQTFSYEIQGEETIYIGEGDRHDTFYTDYGKTRKVTDLKGDNRVYSGLPISTDGNVYSVSVYPSPLARELAESGDAWRFTMVAVAIFVFTSCIFWTYDVVVERRQKKVVRSAEKSNAIVSSLFPRSVRDRLFKDSSLHGSGTVASTSTRLEHNKTRLKTFLSNDRVADGDERRKRADKPIADLFPNCTVCFGDIAGFTAWSSVREPEQVFLLLETLYASFDEIAMKRGVFKVETIGDSYVAVTGLPTARPDHAVAMVRFARDILRKMTQDVDMLETQLGPDTGDLKLRLGIHSGAVTAGVLRGQKSRFQLFGDTVNTASRMESTGVPNCIQASAETVEQLKIAGKSTWVTPRDEKIEAKGKGLLQTYWIRTESSDKSMRASTRSEISEVEGNVKTDRLIKWSTDVLSGLLKDIVGRRAVCGDNSKQAKKDSSFSHRRFGQGIQQDRILDEVKEIIELPEYNEMAFMQQEDPTNTTLPKGVTEQLQSYIVLISELYHRNPFHNFDHATHVTMSVAKLLHRIVRPEEVLVSNGDAAKKKQRSSEGAMGSSLHDHTFGITSDPLTQFACVFAALVHDVDHSGVPNSTLVKEGTTLAKIYHGKSVAEQNSVDLAWNLLMDDDFAALRKAICPNEADLRHFRQLVVNVVMATDIMDPDLKKARNMRWEKAFSPDMKESPKDRMNRKATIVMEHLIQASDVAHTMQHWHVYVKWNSRLFEEMYVAFLKGRSDTDPSKFWYKGEMMFFDKYVLPLSRKLRDCGVFGVSSDEYYNYALKNRQEWEIRGREVVEGLVYHCTKTYKPKRNKTRKSSM